MTPRNFATELLVAEDTLRDSSVLMRRLIAKHGPCTLKPKWKQGPYESLIRAVVFQQLNGKAAQTILDRLIDLFPETDFPNAEQILDASEDRLRSAGLSRQKVSYLRDIALQSITGVVPIKRAAFSRVADEDIIRRLTQVRGVGRWTSEMMLIFTLGRLDVLPVDDFGVRKGFSMATRRKTAVTPRELFARGSQWTPYRSIAAWYFWREADAG